MMRNESTERQRTGEGLCSSITIHMYARQRLHARPHLSLKIVNTQTDS
jgi:hypothetical protein